MKAMRSFPLVFVMTLFSLVTASDKVFPYPILKNQLDNGLQVVTVPFDSPGIVTFYMVVRVGSREEIEKGVTGFAHFFEHCMFRGTEKYPKEKYGQVLQEIAAAGNANTWIDRTCYYFTGNADHLEKMFEIESDRFQFLKYSEHDFKTEAGAVLGEYTKNFSNPYRQVMSKITETAFDKHTYKHSTMGFIEDIKDMPNQYNYSLTFYERFYRPEYCTLMVVGDANHDKIMGLAKKYFGNWKRGSYQPEYRQEPPQNGERKAHIKFPGGMNLVTVTFRSPAFSDSLKDKAALDLLLEIGFSEKSEIYQKLVQNEQKAQSVGSLNFDTRDPYFLGVLAIPFKVEDTAYIRGEIEKAIEKLKKEPVSAADLAAIQSRTRYGMAGSFATPQDAADNLANYIWLTGDPESLNRVYDIYAKITPADLQAAANKYLVNDSKTVVTLSAEEEGR